MNLEDLNAEQIIEIVVEKSNNPSIWCCVKLSLIDLAQTKNSLFFSENFVYEIRSEDSESKAYTIKQWSSGIITGGQFVLRKANLVFEKGFVVYKLCGNLQQDGILGISFASAIAIKKLLMLDTLTFEIERPWRERIFMS